MVVECRKVALRDLTTGAGAVTHPATGQPSADRIVIGPFGVTSCSHVEKYLINELENYIKAMFVAHWFFKM